MKNNIKNWIIEHSDNVFLVVGVTFLFPRRFLKSCLQTDINTAEPDGNPKKACLTISFDCDYSRDIEAIPEVLELMRKFKIKTSFACVGYWVEKYPDIHKMILDYGHEIMNHTYSHPDNDELTPGRKFREISYAEKKEEVERCHAVCEKILSYKPTGCRIPHFKNLFTPEIYRILKELGYKYSSSTLLTNTKSSGMPFKTAEGIYEFPLTTCPRHPFTVFDTWHSFNSPRWFYRLIHRTEAGYIDLFKYLIDLSIDTGSYVNIYIDPYDILKMKRFEELLKYLDAKRDFIRIASYMDIMEKLERGI